MINVHLKDNQLKNQASHNDNKKYIKRVEILDKELTFDVSGERVEVELEAAA